jgi:probable F420-dependent oxidoreductase
MTEPAYYRRLAETAEEVGFHSMSVADSLLYPRESDAEYPYTQEGGREFLEDKPFIETFTLMSALGAVTRTLTFDSFVLKLPVRPPVLVAKQASSVACLTGNRVRLGVGLSPWPEDYRAMGVPWERRGKRMDEAIDIVRGLTTGEYFSYRGEIFDIPEIKLCPAPTEPIPILVGGHSDAALRRSVRRGDGWMHAGGTPEELDALLDKLAAVRRAEGHDRPFEIQAATSQAFTVDGVRRLEDRGVTEVRVGFRNPYQKGPDTEPLQRKLDKLRRYADEVIANIQD